MFILHVHIIWLDVNLCMYVSCFTCIIGCDCVVMLVNNSGRHGSRWQCSNELDGGEG